MSYDILRRGLLSAGYHIKNKNLGGFTMKRSIKSFLTTPFVCLVLIISMFALPFSVNAEVGTLGKETPELTCAFTGTNGKKADGNRLQPGTYFVDLVLSGMKAVSIVELTATYDPDVITDISVLSTYADEHEDMRLGGQKIENNTLSVFQVAESDDASTIDTNGTVMVSLSVTVASSCDFADVFAFSRNPDLCFIGASYLDGKNDCYVLDTSVQKPYKTYPMTADASPTYLVTEFDVSGNVTIANETTGVATTAPAGGITVSVKGTDKSTVTNADGSYTLKGLEIGEYTLVFSGAHTIDREAKLVVARENADYDQITVNNIGICVLDYNKDGKVNSTDVALFSKFKTDLNGDSEFNEEDFAIFKLFLRHKVAYTQLNLN